MPLVYRRGIPKGKVSWHDPGRRSRGNRACPGRGRFFVDPAPPGVRNCRRRAAGTAPITNPGRPQIGSSLPNSSEGTAMSEQTAKPGRRRKGLARRRKEAADLERLKGMTLKQLKREANAEHGEAIKSLRTGVMHALKAGEALREIRDHRLKH